MKEKRDAKRRLPEAEKRTLVYEKSRALEETAEALLAVLALAFYFHSKEHGPQMLSRMVVSEGLFALLLLPRLIREGLAWEYFGGRRRLLRLCAGLLLFCFFVFMTVFCVIHPEF